jgi:phage terminase small subunit
MFIKEYLIDLNATQAAIRAGYSEKTANRIAAENLSKPVLQLAIKGALDARAQRTGITADRVLEEIGKIAFSKLGDFVDVEAHSVSIKDFAGVDTSLLAEVSETTTAGGSTKRIKLHDKMKALELAGRHLGLFKDGNININISKLEDFV